MPSKANPSFLSPVARWGATAAVALLACAAAPLANSQTLLTYFNFNDSNTIEDVPPGGTAPNGDGFLSTIMPSLTNGVSGFTFATGTTLNAIGADPAGFALTVTAGAGTTSGGGNNGKSFEFTVSTANYTNISLSYATRRTGTGFTSQLIQYSTDGGLTFSTVGTFSAFNGSDFTLASFNLPSGAKNQPTIIIRFTLSGATNANGTNNFDNIQVNGTPVVPVPEPATLVGGLLGVAGLCFHQRRRLIQAIRPRLAA